MTTIAEENAKTLRKSMEVYCGFSTMEDATLATTVTGAKVSGNIDGAEMELLCDLAGNGVPLDYNHYFLRNSPYDTKKTYGIRSNIGGDVTIKVKPSKTIRGVCITVTSGTGVIICDGIEYEANRFTTVAVSSGTSRKTITLRSTDPERRIEVNSVEPGVKFEFTNDSLINCNVNLRSDLSDTPTLPISELEFEAYLDFQTPEMFSQVPENSPVWFYAGYADDYSAIRNFYLSEKIEYANKVISLKAEDASARFDDIEYAGHSDLGYYSPSGFLLEFRKLIKNTVPETYIKEDVSDVDSFYELDSSTNFVIKAQAARDLIASFMNLCEWEGHSAYIGDNTINPYFIDAGRPTLGFFKNTTPVIEIEEGMVADLVESYNRNVIGIKSDDEYGAMSKLGTQKQAWDYIVADKNEITSISPPEGRIFSFIDTMDSNIEEVSVTPFDATYKTKITPTEKSGTQYTWWDCENRKNESNYTNGGKLRIVHQKLSKLYATYKNSNAKYGEYITIDPPIYGTVTNPADDKVALPNYKKIFNRSNKTGSFTWRGDPRIQPRDVFTFNKLDGTSVVCTFETISLSFSEGGLTSEVTYREGVM